MMANSFFAQRPEAEFFAWLQDQEKDKENPADMAWGLMSYYPEALVFGIDEDGPFCLVENSGPVSGLKLDDLWLIWRQK